MYIFEIFSFMGFVCVYVSVECACCPCFTVTVCLFSSAFFSALFYSLL